MCKMLSSLLGSSFKQVAELYTSQGCAGKQSAVVGGKPHCVDPYPSSHLGRFPAETIRALHPLRASRYDSFSGYQPTALTLCTDCI